MYIEFSSRNIPFVGFQVVLLHKAHVWFEWSTRKAGCGRQEEGIEVKRPGSSTARGGCSLSGILTENKRYVRMGRAQEKGRQRLAGSCKGVQVEKN